MSKKDKEPKMPKAHSLREKVVGEYRVYELLEDSEYEYTNIFGDKTTYSFNKGQKVYESIDYRRGLRTHYFSKPTGRGGMHVDTIKEVENNPLKYKFIGIKKYE